MVEVYVYGVKVRDQELCGSHLQYPTPLPPSLINHAVSVDLKHHRIATGGGGGGVGGAGHWELIHSREAFALNCRG